MTNAEVWFSNSLRPRKPEGSLGRTAQDVHLDSHTAPELWVCMWHRTVVLTLCCRLWLIPATRIDTCRICGTHTCCKLWLMPATRIDTCRICGTRGYPSFNLTHCVLQFIAHASCQEHLMSMWYSGVPWFQHQPFTMKLFLLPLGIMFIPVTAMVYVFVPYSKVQKTLLCRETKLSLARTVGTVVHISNQH